MNQIEKFKNYVKTECIESGIECDLVPDRYVTIGNKKANGYFDDEARCLRLAIGQPEEDWIPLLVHEFGHFLQWKHDDPEWIRACNDPVVIENNLVDGYAVIDKWLEGEEFSDEILDVCAEIARNIELGCERRAISLIKEWELPIDVTYYAQRGSAYVYFYNVMRECRQWYEIGKEPYNIPEVLSVMPTDLSGDYNNTPEIIRLVIKEHCINKG